MTAGHARECLIEHAKEAVPIGPAVVHELGEGLARIEEDQLPIRNRAVHVLILKIDDNALAMLSHRDNEEAIACDQSRTKKLAHRLEEERLFLVEVYEMVTVSGR